MAVEVKIPSVGESITSGTIAQWHKKSGDHVDRGEVLFALETDKISTEIEAEESGTLEIIAEEGTEVPIGAVVATISSEGGAAEVSISEKPVEPGKVGEADEPSAVPAKVEEADEPSAVPAKVEEKPVPGGGVRIERVAAAAEKAAAMMLSKTPKEPGATAGRFTVMPPIAAKTDTDTESKAAIPAGPAAPAARPPVADDRVSRARMSPLRKKIATHLVSAQQNAAILTTFNECDMSAVMGVRKQVQEAFVAKHGVKLGFMSFFIKAVVHALKEVPQVNARVDGDEIVTNHYYDVGVAVGTERGLIVPVVRDCDGKDLATIEKDIAGYAQRAREGKIQLADLQGGVFTISNGGIYGSMLSTPILNPPQSGILGMHTIQERPVAVDGKVVIRPMMYLALSYDHRIVDGKEAVTFLIRVKECIEEPARLMVEA